MSGQRPVIVILLTLLSEGLPRGTCEWPEEVSEGNEWPLSLRISNTARLYGFPGSTHIVPVELVNPGLDDLAVLLSFTESFPVYNLNTITTHAELVAGVEPSEVLIPANATISVDVQFPISDYVPARYRSKVVIIAQPFMTNSTSLDYFSLRRETCFYFTVVDLQSSLLSYDQSPPTCVSSTKCSNNGGCRDLAADACAGQTFKSEFRIKDSGSGLGESRLVWPEDADILAKWDDKECYGSNDEQVIIVETSCCHTSLAIKVYDLAGNSVQCEIGDVPKQSDSSINLSTILTFIISYILLCLVS